MVSHNCTCIRLASSKDSVASTSMLVIFAMVRGQMSVANDKTKVLSDCIWAFFQLEKYSFGVVESNSGIRINVSYSYSTYPVTSSLFYRLSIFGGKKFKIEIHYGGKKVTIEIDSSIWREESGSSIWRQPGRMKSTLLGYCMFVLVSHRNRTPPWFRTFLPPK